MEHEIQLQQEEERDHRIARCKPHEGLKRIRKDHQRSQAEMADLLGISRRTYQDFENGKRAIPSDGRPPDGHFDCDLHQLFTGSRGADARKRAGQLCYRGPQCDLHSSV